MFSPAPGAADLAEPGFAAQVAVLTANFICHLGAEGAVRVLHRPGQAGTLRPDLGIVEAGALNWDLWGLGSQRVTGAPTQDPRSPGLGWIAAVCRVSSFSCGEFQERRGPWISGSQWGPPLPRGHL